MAMLFAAQFFKKGAFCLFSSPKQIPFSTIFNEEIFAKTKGTRLSVNKIEIE